MKYICVYVVVNSFPSLEVFQTIFLFCIPFSYRHTHNQKYRKVIANDILEAACITWTMKMCIIVVPLTKRQNHVFLYSTTNCLFCAITQANETGDSQQTELEGAKRCFAYLQQLGLSITIFVRLT